MTDLVTGGEAVTAALEALGVTCVFGVPSQQNLALYDALLRIHADWLARWRRR